jgi:uncharacterized damage-inducible protein DinB
MQEFLKEQIFSLQQLIEQLSDSQYTYQSAMLGKATIGQHVRHIIELAQCLVSGYEQGIVDYDKRKRDERIETTRSFAFKQLNQLLLTIQKPERKLVLTVCINNKTEFIETLFNRELLYNTEHAIHHMALIKVVLNEMQLNIVKEDFGVAYATLQYRKNICAQ